MNKYANKLFLGYSIARLIIYYLFCSIFSHLYSSDDSTQFFSSLDFKISASVLVICALLYIAIVIIVQKCNISKEDYSFDPNLIDNIITGCIMVVGTFMAIFNLGDVLESSWSLIGFSLLLLGGAHLFIKGFYQVWE